MPINVKLIIIFVVTVFIAILLKNKNEYYEKFIESIKTNNTISDYHDFPPDGYIPVIIGPTSFDVVWVEKR